MNHLTELFLLLFLGLTFIQSGLEKAFDFKGNVAWLKTHFANTFLANIIPLCLSIILVLEIIASILAIAAIVTLYQSTDKHLAVWCGIISSITLLLLLFGQRVAKDYDGARTIVIYLIPTIFLLYILSK